MPSRESVLAVPRFFQGGHSHPRRDTCSSALGRLLQLFELGLGRQHFDEDVPTGAVCQLGAPHLGFSVGSSRLFLGFVLAPDHVPKMYPKNLASTQGKVLTWVLYRDILGTYKPMQPNVSPANSSPSRRRAKSGDGRSPSGAASSGSARGSWCRRKPAGQRPTSSTSSPTIARVRTTRSAGCPVNTSRACSSGSSGRPA